jgi:hypothetical protein
MRKAQRNNLLSVISQGQSNILLNKAKFFESTLRPSGNQAPVVQLLVQVLNEPV